MRLVCKKILELCVMLSVVAVLGIIIRPEMRLELALYLTASITCAIVIFILIKNKKDD